MKIETAARLLSMALEHDDLDAMEVACQHRPWTKPQILSNPLSPIIAHLEAARSSRREKIATMRQRVLPYLQLLARHGYAPSGPAMAGLAAVDAPSFIAFARTAREFTAEHPAHALILHRLLAASTMQPAWIKPLVSMGFDPNHADAKGNTPAHALADAMFKSPRAASMKNRIGAIELLLDLGADTTRPNHAGTTPADTLLALATQVDNDATRQTLSRIVAQAIDAATPRVRTTITLPRL